MTSPFRHAGLIMLLSVVAACAAPRAEAPAPASPSDSAAPGTEPAGYPVQSPPAGHPQPAPAKQEPGADAAGEDRKKGAAASSPTAGPEAPAPPSAPGTSGSYAAPPNRRLALTQAKAEVEASQRELDVAGGDCHNACRALGSMDRAAGRLCQLAQSGDEVQRCDDAKTRVYTARDRVRTTCGSCPDVTVERSAPIPSR